MTSDGGENTAVSGPSVASSSGGGNTVSEKKHKNQRKLGPEKISLVF